MNKENVKYLIESLWSEICFDVNVAYWNEGEEYIENWYTKQFQKLANEIGVDVNLN